MGALHTSPLAPHMADFYIDPDEDVCAICIDVHRDPVGLDCKHHYCRECAKLLVKENDTSHASFFIVCALCQQQTNLQADRNLQRRKPDPSFLSKRDARPLSFSSVENLEQKMAQLKTPSEAIMPRNIKLLQEYDYSIGKEGKSLIPPEHGGMLSYGTIDSTDTSLSKWDAMIIGPQEVNEGRLMDFPFALWISNLFYLVSHWTSRLLPSCDCAGRVSTPTSCRTVHQPTGGDAMCGRQGICPPR